MLELISFILINTVALLLLISAGDKMLHWQKHYIAAKGYKIINGILLKILLTLFLLVEIYVGLSMIIFNINQTNFITFIILISVYTIAVIYNLIIGNTAISCGCGGVLESPNLHVGIVMRNIGLIILITILFIVTDNYSHIFNMNKVIAIFIALYIIFLYGIVKKINSINFYRKKILS